MPNSKTFIVRIRFRPSAISTPHVFVYQYFPDAGRRFQGHYLCSEMCLMARRLSREGNEALARVGCAAAAAQLQFPPEKRNSRSLQAKPVGLHVYLQQRQRAPQFRVRVVEMRREADVILSLAVGPQRRDDAGVSQFFVQGREVLARLIKRNNATRRFPFSRRRSRP